MQKRRGGATESGSYYRPGQRVSDTPSVFADLVVLFLLVLIIDLLVPNDASQWFYNHIVAQDKAPKIYPECYHEILTEKEEKDLVIADMVDWITGR